MVHNAAMVAGLISTFETGSLASGMKPWERWRSHLFLHQACLRELLVLCFLVLPHPKAWGQESSRILFQSHREILPISTLCCGIPDRGNRFVSNKSFKGFATRFLGITLLDLNDGRRIPQSTKTRGQAGNAERTKFEP